MKKSEALETLHEIKNMMEKSSRFQSISGLSIIIVGLYACLTTLIVYGITNATTSCRFIPEQWINFSLNTPHNLFIGIMWTVVLFLISFGTIVLMAWHKSKKHQLRFVIDRRLLQMIFHFILPIGIGGVLCLALIMQGHYGLTSSLMLLFYGLALVNCQHYTYPTLQFLGYAEILLGIIDCFVVNQALLFWFLGFGILHIIFGIFYIIKHEKQA